MDLKINVSKTKLIKFNRTMEWTIASCSKKTKQENVSVELIRMFTKNGKIDREMSMHAKLIKKIVHNMWL